MTKIQKKPHDVNGITVEQRLDNGFINGTAMCVAHGKDINDWFTTKDVFELFVALANDLEIEIKTGDFRDLDISRLSGSKYAQIFPGLVTSKRGSPETGGGTWLHYDLAIQLAQWCNKPFAIQVSRWVREWMTTGQNPVYTREDVDRLVYRTNLKDEARLRAGGQVKNYLVEQELYDDRDFKDKFFADFHDAINLVITGEKAWQMRLRLSKLIGKKVTEKELIRDYFPPIPLQYYISINNTAANLMRLRGLHPITAVEEASILVLPAGYTPSPIDFAEHIDLVRQRVNQLPTSTNTLLS